MTPPANIDLAALGANCTLVAQNGDCYRVHRAVAEQYPGFAKMIPTDDLTDDLGRQNGGVRVQLNIASEVLKLVVLWMYGVSWEEYEEDVGSGNVSGLAQFMRVADAAEKYRMPDLETAAYELVAQGVFHLPTIEDHLRIIRELTRAEDMGSLQRTLIDRILDSLKRDKSVDRYDTSISFQSKENVLPGQRSRSVQLSAYPTIIKIPSKDAGNQIAYPEASLSKPAATKSSSRHPSSALGTWSRAQKDSMKTGSKAKLHCVCQAPEDRYLVQCDSCDEWFHPACIGKGKYAASTNKAAKLRCREGDERHYREGNLSFSCLECDGAGSSGA